jgi:hypothetical protein
VEALDSQTEEAAAAVCQMTLEAGLWKWGF